jgi:hypothetical protein
MPFWSMGRRGGVGPHGGRHLTGVDHAEGGALAVLDRLAESADIFLEEGLRREDLHDPREDPAVLLVAVPDVRVEGPEPLPAVADEFGGLQERQMPRDLRLGEAERPLDVADADLVCGDDQVEDPEP